MNRCKEAVLFCKKRTKKLLSVLAGAGETGVTAMQMFFAACFGLLLLIDPAVAGTVGFTQIMVPDGTNPPIKTGIWYPAKGTPQPTHVGLFIQTLAPDAPVDGRMLPLVVMSHGNGGNFAGHSDTAFALASAGFVVAAPTHTGDNFRDQSRALDVAGRARGFAAVLDYMISSWRTGSVDAARAGAFGFSSGGLTVLIAAGGEPDLGLIAPHCVAHPDFYDCRLIKAHPEISLSAELARQTRFTHDAHIRAAVVAAPALGFTFDATRLRAVAIPVQLWRAGDDSVLPNPFYAEAVRTNLPHAPDYHVVEHAGHFDFLAPCPAALAQVAPAICISEPGFDRARFHTAFNEAVVAFFLKTLAP